MSILKQLKEWTPEGVIPEPFDIVDLPKPKKSTNLRAVSLDEIDSLGDHPLPNRSDLLIRFWFLMGILYGQLNDETYNWFCNRIRPDSSEGEILRLLRLLEPIARGRTGPRIVKKYVFPLYTSVAMTISAALLGLCWFTLLVILGQP